MIDEFGFDISPDPVSEEIKNFVRVILAWQNDRQQLNPEDVLDYLIEEQIISYDNMWKLANEPRRNIILPKVRYNFR